MTRRDLTERRRAPRAVPHPGRSLRFTERDRWLLESLAKMRFLTTSQLARLGFGGSCWAANKRLRKLLDGRLVRVWLRSLADENVYSVTPAGSTAAADGSEESDAVVPRGLDGNLDHLLAINTVRIALALGLSDIGAEITWWRSDWDLRARVQERVIPDGLFAMRWESGREQVFALEVDNRTKSLRAFVAKVLRYGALLAHGRGLYGLGGIVTIVVGRDARWVSRFRQSLAHMRLDSQVWFAVLADVEAQGPLGQIWKAPADESAHSLREVGYLPYGKERAKNENSRVDHHLALDTSAHIPMYPFVGMDSPS
jgi:hypothetical protein